jgi:PAS domain S-box-containing protein
MAGDYMVDSSFAELQLELFRAQKKIEQLEKSLAETSISLHTDTPETETGTGEDRQNYRDLYENANDILYTMDLDGYFTSANKTALRIYGYSSEEFLALNYEKIVDPAYTHLAKKSITEKVENHSSSTTIELLTRTRQGNPVWVEVSTRLIKKDNITIGIQGIARDISERKKSEKELHESQIRFKEIADLLPGIICEMDMTLNLTYVNQMGFDVFGYTGEDFENGICVRDLVSNEHLGKFEDTVKILVVGGYSAPSVYALCRKDKSLVHALLSSAAIVRDGKICGIRTCFFDISDRVLAEEKLRLSEERFRSIYSESPIGIALSSPDGFLFDMNSSFRTLFKFSDTDYLQLSLFKILGLDKKLVFVLQSGKSVNCETELLVNDGEKSGKRFFDWYVTPVNSSGTEPSVYLVQVQDITGNKEAQNSRIKEEQQATARAEMLVAGLKRELREKASFYNMVSRSSQMIKIFDSIPEIAEAMVTVLISGDSGTGKELIARSLHELSSRKDNPFIAINCSALPDTLLESELFGYKAGAFTDAKKDKPGKFSLAEGGTIFLDEIGDISPAMQVRLLRVLQEKVFEPLGGTKPVKANVRVIAATNKSLSGMVKSGEFREDLYYRINVISINLPPLRERRCDIPLLAEHFIQRCNDRYGKSISGISHEATGVLLSYDFPGNIRELENVIEHAFIFCKDAYVELKHLPEALRNHGCGDQKNLSGIRDFEELERMYLKCILEESGGNKLQAAKRLGIHKTTLFRKLRHLGI